jgi:PAS domain S-box-containing protein
MNKEASSEFLGINSSSPDITDRMALEQALRLSEQRYRLALSGSPMLLWECDTDLRFTFVDNLQPPITHPAQIIGKRDDEILPFDCVRELIEIKKRVLATGAGERGEISVPAADEMFHFEVVVEPIYNSDGVISGLRGLAIDISQQKRREQALWEREQRLRLALSASGAGCWIRNARTGRVDWDDRFCEIYGFAAGSPGSFEAWLGRVHEDDRRQVLELWDQNLHEKTLDTFDVTFRIVRPDGTVAWIQSLGQAHRDANGQVVRLTGIELDVTERRRSEDALEAHRHQERERTVQRLLDTAPQGILSIDAQGVIMRANCALEKMFGWAPGELIGRSVEELVPPQFWDRPAYRTAYFEAPQSLPITLDLTGQRKDGSTFPIEISLNHVITAAGGRAIAFVSDISARKQAEEAIRRSHAELERRAFQLRRLASDLTLAEQHTREELARTLHDGLQQLLFSAGLTLDRAVKGASKPSQVGLILGARADINEAIEMARTLSVNLFPPMLHISGLPAALTWLAKRTEEQYNVVVNVTAEPQANPEASDIRILLFQSVRELLFNAVKHAHADRIDIDLQIRPGDTIYIEVNDQGVGFDPAVTLDHKNQQQSGLGLFSIQERLAFFGGHLGVQSAPGNGARFSLTIPQSNLRHVTTDGAKAKRPDAAWQDGMIYDSVADMSKPLRVLIADDHVVARAGLRELFGEGPALQVVGEAANGVEAISQGLALQPDVIVMDVSMPQMNGIEATREIHEALPHIRIVGLSTLDDENSELAMREAGAEAYFTKNEGAEQLLNYLQTIQTQAKGPAKS